MAKTISWQGLADEVQMKFPNVDDAVVRAQVGDVAALIHHIATTHDLTIAEAAEVVTFRLPQFVEPERISA